ncbi:hypothetical protein [Nostoc sp. CCY 9925]|uniref:hypothetical protein n=1 Tax=Nostoc sp. CCY 9925 TaxID=3103865 RepID=UPI0039C678F0
MNLPDEILSVLRRGEIEYTKAQAIARVKSEQQRAEMLKIAIAENLSLSEIKRKVNEIQSQSKTNLDKLIFERFNKLNKLLHKKNSLINSQDRIRVIQLLDELEKIVGIG